MFLEPEECGVAENFIIGTFLIANYFIYKEIQKRRINFSNLILIEEVRKLNTLLFT
jgi:hypothetical protein